VVPEVQGVETVSLPSLESAEALSAWRNSIAVSGKKKRGPWLPEEPWDVLLMDTGVVQAAGWSKPPGVREVVYGFRNRALVTPARRRRRVPAPPCHLALFALASVVPPDIGRTVSVADRVRRAVMSRTTWLDDEGHRLDERRTDPDDLVSGKGPGGVALEGHRHAFWLPFASDPSSPKLDRLLVLIRAEGGFSARTLEAFKSLKRVWGDGQYDVNVVLLGLGDDARAGCAELLGPARQWVSDTPFVPTRYPKPRKGRDEIEDQVRRGLAQVGLPEPTVVEPFEEPAHGWRWYEFQAQRRGGGARAQRTGLGVRLEFAEPVEGPIAIGWGAHFGMGRFRATKATP
jgi:CRISPR-associated protein Csb2